MKQIALPLTVFLWAFVLAVSMLNFYRKVGGGEVTRND